MCPCVHVSTCSCVHVSRFVEYGQYRGHLYGTSTDAIDEVLNRGRTCILDVEPQDKDPTQPSVCLTAERQITAVIQICWFNCQSVQLLWTKKLKPYVIFIQTPSPKRLRQSRRHARIISSYTASRELTEDDLVEVEEASQLMEDKYKQFDRLTV
ncbi:MAGUK p55 subfamily member 4 [Nibea albiflora]|uniref:MAGUK p55 subfamily member 4 n=1 Tax=Nibea albiflora TaxID=240163 RepID=A0ACB7EEN6_NIBAL|nr:MAGUK p55 subfamily member 4 [Nibea albiflora]